MGRIYNEDKEWKVIHEAYGITLKGKYANYESAYSDYSKIITAISVNGRELDLGYAHFIVAEQTPYVINIEDDKNLLCYMFSRREKPMDDWEFENFFFKEYNGTLWRHRARNRLADERIREEEEKAQTKREAEKAKQIEDFKAYAEKKKLRLIMEYDKAYFVKIDKRRHKDSDKATDEMVLQFAREYPDNGVEIVEEREVV